MTTKQTKKPIWKASYQPDTLKTMKHQMNRTALLIVLTLIHLTMLGFTINVPIAAQAQNSVTSTYESWTFSPYNYENFTIIVLPDTQYYSESFPAVFDNQTQWIADNIEQMNIVFVTHLGDVVDEADKVWQWVNANNSLSKLDGKVPWGVCPGNHDGIDAVPNNFETYFGRERFQNESWYGGSFGDKNQDSYQLFSAGGTDFLFLHLQYDPNDYILEWAGNVIDSYPSRQVIISTHEYVDWHWMPWHSSIGEKVYEKLVKPHADQILLVLCGHIEEVDTRTQVIGDNVVYEMISDYQEQPNGGDGWLKILQFSPLNNKISVKTYSPYLNRYNHDVKSEFSLDFNMSTKENSITVQMTNSNLLDFKINVPDQQINVTTSGPVDTLGTCNITYPKDLGLGDKLIINVDGTWTNTTELTAPENVTSWSYTELENVTHRSLVFKYLQLASSQQILIKGTGNIPEFPSQTILIMAVIAVAATALAYKKRMIKKIAS